MPKVDCSRHAMCCWENRLFTKFVTKNIQSKGQAFKS